MSNARAPNQSRKLSVVTTLQLICLLLLSRGIEGSEQRCAYVRRIDLSSFMGDEIASDERNSFATMPGLFNHSTRSPFTDTTIYSELIYVQDNAAELFSLEHKSLNRYGNYIKFESLPDGEPNQIKVSFTNLPELADKSLKFTLKFEQKSCDLTLDFYSSTTGVYANELSSLSTPVLDETCVNYEVVLNSLGNTLVGIKLPELLDNWSADRYSVHCLSCHPNLTLEISTDQLTVSSKGYTVSDAAGSLLFEDMVIELDQYNGQPGEELKRTVLNIRFFLLTSQLRQAIYGESFVVSELNGMSRIQKRANYGAKRRNQKNTALHSALKLAISEETIGLQTKLQIYDYVFTDYMLNASDYVKERIQIVAPQNLMNITKPFDFEEGGGLHQFQIIFKRKTNNRPIIDHRTIIIKVLDLNDEPPVWVMDEPVPYTAVVDRDPRPGLQVFQFLASDPDSQSEIVYTLHSKSPNTSRLAMKEGKLYIESGSPFQYDIYKVLVSAHDAKASPLANSNSYMATNKNGSKSQEIFAELTIIVGKRPPQFYQTVYNVNITENVPIGFNVVQMRAKSFNPDPYNKKHLRYSLQTLQNEQSAEFSIYSENGTVILARSVDYERDLREYNLIVHVTEQSGWLLSSTARLNIYVEDYNDNAPQFTLSEYVRNQPVPEDLDAHTFIIQVEIQDRDSGLNSDIEWTVSNPNFYVRPFSHKHSTKHTHTARIFNKNNLDFEIPQHMYRFDVMACDKGTPKLCASAKVSVPISNVNDEKPKFDQRVILASLDENVPSGAYVTTVQATDGDGDRIFFTLKDNSGPFEINRESGIVKIKSHRNINPREDYYNLTVYATDDGSCCCPGKGNINNGYRVQHYSSQINCQVKQNREEATLVIKIRDINDHAPKFMDCDGYSRVAKVEEQKPAGTPVIQVEAKDLDKGENGEVEYEVLATHMNDKNVPFGIDPITGLISTKVEFDRESGPGEYSITVKAKDRGRPHALSDACSFRIKIVDINDHAPAFYEPEYKLSMKYGTQPGQNIQRIIAYDADSGRNAEIKYRIEQAGNYARYFDVDENTGMVSLKREISHSIRRPIMFNLIAEDLGTPAKSSSVSVSVNFADRDNEPPKWLPETEKRFERTVRIPEAISLNQVVETLDALSNYAPNSKLIFDFSPKPSPESFIIQQERLPGTNQYRGKIIVYQPLDAETQSFYELNVRVQNAAAMPMEIMGVVKVEILDSNDNIPLFTQPTYLATVSENSPAGTYVTKVTAIDKDISAPNNVVIYTLGDQDYSRRFQIDSHTGNITTRQPLDREQISVYFIDVTACDSAMSDRPNMNTPNCRTANVRIDVTDTNDNEPHFNSTLYKASVSEDAERGTPILTIQANDLDENSQLRYIITDGNDENVFAVREQIGEIYVANNGKLDYETRDEYLITLTVSDGLHKATTKVSIQLLDVNDNPPVFTELPPYEIELVEEDLNFPRVILKINATDGDIKRPNTIVFRINYNYQLNGSSFRPFNVNPHTGEIILQEKLDRDYPNGRPIWSFNVIASDEGGQAGSMDSTAVVNVKLIDINDNAPVFDKPPYVGHILENSQPGSLIMSVAANDYDDPQMGHNAVMRYQIAENKKFGNLDVFSINDTTGQIYQNLMLDREQIDKYMIEVCATDGSGKRGCGQVTIYVDDANDQAPVFQASTYTETIGEDFGIGERVLVVTASDKDQGINAELSYGLKSECLVRNPVYTGDDAMDCVEGVREPIFFKVDTEREANSGFIKLAKRVNYDPPDYHRLFKLNVSVSDGVAVNYTTVFINIADVNDEAPRFKQPVQNVQVRESIPAMTLITNFTAEDLDTNELNRRFSYSLDRKSEGSHEFTIDQQGRLYNLEPLDRESKDKYILRIFATDQGYPPLTGIATLNLELIDVNDNHPIFADNYMPIVMENTRQGGFMTRVKAKDLDDPTNGPPFVFELPDRLSVWPKAAPKFNMTYVTDEFNRDSYAEIYSLATFDREAHDCQSHDPVASSISSQPTYDTENECKQYKIPIIMKDAGKPPVTGINYLTVIVGDRNDNVHSAGTKTIRVYDYKGSVSRTQRITFIGTVYSEDKDDWDLSDKEFKFDIGTDDNIRRYFTLVESMNDVRTNGNYDFKDRSPGSIFLKAGVKPGNYEFRVSVYDTTRPMYAVQVSTVKVEIKQIGEDMVQNSGSFRLAGISAERLIETRYSSAKVSLLDEIRRYLALNVMALSDESNLEIFSIQEQKGQRDEQGNVRPVVDIRYWAHGSPIYTSQRLNGLLAHNRAQFQQWLDNKATNIDLVVVGIDGCASAERQCKNGGCRSSTEFEVDRLALVNANETALVGVFARAVTECSCKSLQGFTFAELNTRSCSDPNYCLNGGMCLKSASVQKCQCLPGFHGPRCQRTVRSFNSSGGFAWLPALPQCQDLVISLEFISTKPRGLIFYNGPVIDDSTRADNVRVRKSPSLERYQQDFVALQLDKGRLIFQVRQGVQARTQTFVFNNYNRSLADGLWHRVDIYKTDFKYRITVDRCIESDYYNGAKSNAEVSMSSEQGDTTSTFIAGCEHEMSIELHDLYLSSNQHNPLQLGGVYDKDRVPSELKYRGSFVGCMRNLKVNGELYDLELDTPKSLGFHANSAPNCERANRLCNPKNETNYCTNGVCDANFFRAQCTCQPGYRGRNCEFKALPFDFQTPGINKKSGSYLKYRYVHQSDSRHSVYDAYLKRFTKIQLLFRTRQNSTNRVQTLFQITSPNRAQYVYLELSDNRLQFRYDIGGGESLINIAYVPINDGRWHMARAERFGREASLILDDGEGLKMNYTFGLPTGHNEMDVDRDSIFLGARVIQIKVSGYEVSRDYQDSCMMDVRFDDKPLPYTSMEEKAYEDIAIKMEQVNVRDGCASDDYCTGIFCLHNQKCVDQWRLGECQCPTGQVLNGSRCIDLNDCHLCHRQGTKYCEKFDETGIIAYENFNDNYLYDSNRHLSSVSTVGAYPPDSWFVNSELNRELKESRRVWTLNGSDMDEASGHKCVCRKGWFGPMCNAQARRSNSVFMSYEAWAIILLCAIVSMVIIMSFVAYSRTKRPIPKHYMMGVDPHDEVRETIINYVEEGCPDVDQSAYDITQLCKPLMMPHGAEQHPTYSESSVVDGEFPPAMAKTKPPLQEISFIRRDVPPVTELTNHKAHRPQNTDVGDFINNKLREIDNDPVQPPYDSLQEYAYEGEGSVCGSTLSSLEFNDPKSSKKQASSGDKQKNKRHTADSVELESMQTWGPKFDKISDLYGLKSSQDDAN